MSVPHSLTGLSVRCTGTEYFFEEGCSSVAELRTIDDPASEYDLGLSRITDKCFIPLVARLVELYSG